MKLLGVVAGGHELCSRELVNCAALMTVHGWKEEVKRIHAVDGKAHRRDPCSGPFKHDSRNFCGRIRAFHYDEAPRSVNGYRIIPRELIRIWRLSFESCRALPYGFTL